MKLLMCTCIVSAAVLLQTTISTSPSVVLLDDQNFQHLVLKTDHPWMVNFFAYWDGHAKLFAPLWTQAAEQLKDSGVRFGSYDWGGETPESKKSAVMFGVWKYPHVMYFAPEKKDQPEDYPGGHQVEDIVEWVRERTSQKTEQRTECSDGQTEL